MKPAGTLRAGSMIGCVLTWPVTVEKMNTITAAKLVEEKVRSNQIKIFKKTFGEKAEVTVANAHKALEAGLHIFWLERFIDPQRLVEYYRPITPLRFEYERQIAPLRVEYHRRRALLLVATLRGRGGQEGE